MYAMTQQQQQQQQQTANSRLYMYSQASRKGMLLEHKGRVTFGASSPSPSPAA